MQRKSHELVVALVAILGITLTYLLVQAIYRQTPQASSFYGHSMGIFGFILMLMTETLYSLRKRSHNARWGKMAEWLDFHIFTGLVGPYMVLLHSAWSFKGLAGILSLLTLTIVLSGFIGRYIYTAVPRTPAGVELSLEELQENVNLLEKELAERQENLPGRGSQPAATFAAASAGVIFSRGWWELQTNLNSWFARRRLPEAARAKAKQLAELRRQRDLLYRQIQSLLYVRRLLAIWHAVHIPIGLTLFGMAFIHIIAAVYYSVLTR